MKSGTMLQINKIIIIIITIRQITLTMTQTSRRRILAPTAETACPVVVHPVSSMR